ncbi:sorting nexin-16-like [Actinia tenebrosa]|uniref:Sorting nexin-16-like n=1 Tax=Actinia tenebrosa TaxID=6105 RepID=A0A6P8H9G1_ACTTE|nr:sorting nexin-16-like [Actinia tenebrosa]
MATQNNNTTKAENPEEQRNDQEIHAPIVGYEIVEARKRFTVYQISVTLSDERNWFVFRRYSDFARLDENLRKLFDDGFPDISLPPKRYLGDNFSDIFIEMRKLSLQHYLEVVLGREDMCWTQPVVEFLCLDDPPGPYDSLQESRAFIENLEDTVGDLKQKYDELSSELRLAKAQLRSTLSHRRALLVALRAERVLNGKPALDNDDVALMSEYKGNPEVNQLDLKNFGKEETILKSKQTSRNHQSRSSVASQWDLRLASRQNSRESNSSDTNNRRARSVSDLPNASQRRRSSRHLPSNDSNNMSVLDKFMRQSTDALQQIRQSVRQKLGRWENETND